MPFNGSGTYAAPGSTFNPAVATTTISATDWNALLADLTTALSTCLLKDGQQTPTANIPMGGFKFTGLAAGTGAGNSVRYEQVLLLNGANTMAGDLLFTDATYDIGKTGATRPRDIFASRNLTIGGTAAVTGHVTLEGVTSTGATGSGKLVFDTSPTLATAVLGSSTATTQSAADNSTKLATTAYVDRGASGASWVLITPTTASNSATIDFTSGISSTYDDYVIVITRLVPATNATALLMQMSVDSGANFITAAGSYLYAVYAQGSDAATYGTNSAGDTSMNISGSAGNGISSTAGNGGANFTIYLRNPSSASSVNKLADWNGGLGGNSAFQMTVGAGEGANATLKGSPVNAIRFLMSSGNITSGSFALYGIRKA